MTARLTSKRVLKLVRHSTGRFHDGHGLYLQVFNRKSASWVLRFVRHGKERMLGLGPVHVVGLAEARQRARAARLQLLDGIDPVAERKAKKVAHAIEAAKTITFAECALAYQAAHEGQWRSAKHREQYIGTLRQYAFPVFGELPVAAVDTGLVLRVLEPLWGSRTETARRVRGRIEKVLDWAAVRNYRSGDNPARWKGHLAEALPQRTKTSVPHHPALPYAEVASFMSELRAQDGTGARALEFTILTAARSGEVLGARWGEIDLENRIWVVPASRMKAQREHRVPLSGPTIELLRALPVEDGDDHVFIGAKAGVGLSTMAMPHYVRRMRSNITVHGFRSSFRDWASEQTSFPHEVCEQALAHTITNKVEAAYRRGDLFEKRRRLMDEWAAYCARPVVTGEVVPLRGASDA
jgi:integrase